MPSGQENNEDLTDLVEGTYTLTITDDEDCTYSESFVIGEPLPLTTSLSSQTNISCNSGTDGSFEVQVTGGNPGYIFTLNGSAVSPSSTSGDSYVFSGLSAGVYTLIVTDINSCIANQNINVTLTEPDVITYTYTNTVLLDCYGDSDGSITVTVQGGSPGYEVILTPPNQSAPIANDGGSFTFSNLIAGDYQVRIRDQNYDTSPSGCEVVSSTISIAEPPQLLLSGVIGSNLLCYGDTDGTVTGVITGGTAPYTVALNEVSGSSATITNSGDSFTFSNLASGTYTVSVTDNNVSTLGAGC